MRFFPVDSNGIDGEVFKVMVVEMKRYSIAVIDSCSKEELLVKQARHRIHRIDCVDEEILLQHGAGVINTIFKYCDNVDKLYLYNVFYKNGKTNANTVLKALESIVLSDEIKLVVICITLTNSLLRDKIYEACNALFLKNCIIIAAFHNNPKAGEEYYPASFDNVIGVDKRLHYSPKLILDSIHNRNVIGDDSPELIEMGDGSFAYFDSNSKATAKMAGQILDILGKNDLSIDEIVNMFIRN